ncbi:hypothetical protein F2P81_017029 [Scophthalmus maximus]|uniref:Uncharacterized protein n=1 Tax=Scophthalmus maximus TaxID=52904 RepID=A0A6A4SDG0_SCOMX|nr:hypothetical protein F2P81_017029 [Scophthalmus maximus]
MLGLFCERVNAYALLFPVLYPCRVLYSHMVVPVFYEKIMIRMATIHELNATDCEWSLFSVPPPPESSTKRPTLWILSVGCKPSNRRVDCKCKDEYRCEKGIDITLSSGPMRPDSCLVQVCLREPNTSSKPAYDD